MNRTADLTRSLPPEFLADLMTGMLKPLRAKLKSDDTLMLALRGSYINVYSRGGSILRLQRIKSGSEYKASFDENYGRQLSKEMKIGPTMVVDSAGACRWVEAFKDLKEVMNTFFSENRRMEREFQQLVAWENNRSTVANATEYFITDIELGDSEQRAKIDMLGVKWLKKDRRTGLKCRPVFFEMKYGDKAIEGDSGIAKHVRDLTQMLANEKRREALSHEIIEQFEQLTQLGFIRYNRSTQVDRFKISQKPEVVFLLANHNPRSKVLLRVLEQIEESPDFDLRFFVASFAGYSMYDACMLRLNEFRDLVQKLLN
jgi:hypothetical protein